MTDKDIPQHYGPNDPVEELDEIEMYEEPRALIHRGEEVNITRKDPAIRQIEVGVGWELRRFEGDPLDLDFSVLLLDKTGKTRVDEDFVFYNNMKGPDGAVRHLGDSRTGAGEGDDEIIYIDLGELSFDIVKIAFVLSIYDLDDSGHDFSMVKDVYFRLVNEGTKHEIFRFELDEQLGSDTAILIGELERIGSEWVYTAKGKSVKGGLGKIASDCGIIVAQILPT